MRVSTASGAHACAIDMAHGSAATGSNVAKPPGGGAVSTAFHAYSVSVPSSVSASGRFRSATRCRTASVVSRTRVVTSVVAR